MASGQRMDAGFIGRKRAMKRPRGNAPRCRPNGFPIRRSHNHKTSRAAGRRLHSPPLFPRIHLSVGLPTLRRNMPVDTKPEDKPAAVCFNFDFQDNGLAVSCSPVGDTQQRPYSIQSGAPHFTNRDDFKAKVVSIGMSPAVAEDERRSFNATARQLRELGFSVRVKKKAA